MTANEMSYEFDVLYDSIASLDSPGYTAQEKSVLLTKAQEIFVDRYNKAEYTERRRRDLANLTRTVDISTASTTQDTGKPNGTRYDLPTDLMYIESEEVTIGHSETCFNGNRIMVIPQTEDAYAIQKYDPFKKPQVIGSSYDCFWRMDFNDNASGGSKRVDLITDGTATVSTYHLTYIKTPVDIVPVIAGDSSTTTVSNCELNDTAHREIVEMAIRLAAGTTKPQEYQLKVNEEKINN